VVAIAATVLMVLFRLALAGVLDDDAPYLPFMLAVVAAAWWGGLMPGLLATGLSFLAGNYLFLVPVGTFWISQANALIHTIVFLTAGTLISVLCQALHEARQHSEQRHRELQREIHGRERAEARESHLRSAQSALMASEARFRALVEATTSIVWTVQEGQGMVHEQPSWAAYSGQRWEEYQGQGWLQAIHPEDRERVWNAWHGRNRLGKIHSSHGRLWHAASGRYRHYESRAVPVPGGDGTTREWVGMCLDVEDRWQAVQALLDSEERFQLAVEAVDGIIYESDLTAGQVSRSRGLQPVLGYHPDEVPPTLDWWREQIHPGDRDRIQDEVGRIIAGQDRYSVEYRVRHRDGQYIHLLDQGVVRRDATGCIIRQVGCSQDISARKRMEQELRDRAEELADAHRRKDDFLATLAHELRNPLAPISTALELLKADDGADPTQMREVLQLMERQLRQLVHLIDDLLDISRISRGKMQLRRARVALAAVVNDAVDTVRPTLQTADLTLDVALPAEPVWLDCDPTRLAQILGNLLNNAAKYNRPGGHVWLSAQTRDATLTVRVRDDGIGIEAPQLAAIFEMFAQVTPALDRPNDGLGIGLALVRALVELHGGEVRAHSEGTGRGSEFTVRLPIVGDAATPAADEPAPARESPTRDRRILVVDDNHDTVTALAALMERFGYEVRAAYDGPGAVAEARAFRPDIALLDIGLPGLNGYEVASAIREAHWGKSVILVALTGWGQDQDKRQAQESGFDYHITKPVDLGALREILGGGESRQSAV